VTSRVAGRYLRGLRPGTTLAALVVVAFAAYAVYGAFATVPRFLLDELYYLEAGTSLGQGHGLRFREQSWGYGPVFPGLIAILVRFTTDQELTVALVRVVNAAAYALTLVPVYFLARRLLRPWSALGVAAFVAILPSTTYTSLVMTESTSFLVIACAFLAMIRALERPTVARQLLVLALLALAIGIRTQFIVLLAAWPLSIGLMSTDLMSTGLISTATIRGGGAGGGRLGLLHRWWPTGVLGLGAGVLYLVSHFLHKSSGRGLGAYDALLRDYSVGQVVLSIVRQVGDLAIFMGVVPLVVAPIAVAMLVRRARDGDVTARAFVALAIPASLVLLITVGMFASSEYAVGSLHDRNLFYVYPFWLILFVGWLEGGLPRPRGLLFGGLVLAVAAVSFLPFGEIAAEGWLEQHEAPSTEGWGLVNRVVPHLPFLMIGFTVLLAVAAAVLPTRRRWVLPTVVAMVLAGNLALAWRSAFIDPAANGAAPRGSRAWVDQRIGGKSHATLLLMEDACHSDSIGRSGLMTLFFNRAALDSVVIGDQGVAKPRTATMEPDGSVRLDDGQLLSARYIVTQPGVSLEGSPLGRGAPAGLVLWRTDGGPVRLDVPEVLALRDCQPG
jgi:Dolichyl-phosphate-mannose-protein mannosyltransferase